MFAQQGQDEDRAVARALTTHDSRATARIFRRFRASLATAAVTATALVALTAATAGTAASAATVRPAHAVAHAARAQLSGHDAARRSAAATLTGVTWHPLTLLNGWQSAESLYGTGDPAWAIKNGIVYLSGSLTQPGGGPTSSTEFADLPQAAWPAPAQDQTIPDFTLGGAQGFIDVTDLGFLYAFSPTSGPAQAFTSLAGISYPAASAATTKLTLLNGWKATGSGLGIEWPAYAVTGGVVHLSGQLKQPTGTNPEFAVLPAADRPAHLEYFPVRLDGTVVGVLTIKPNGQMSVYGAGAGKLTNLSGVSFLVASKATTSLALLNGWQSQGQSGTGDPAYSVTGGVVHLPGSLAQPGGGSTEFAVLPQSAWPAHTLYITTYAYNGAPGAVSIAPDGTVYAFSPNPGDAQAFTSLAGISYPAGS